MDLEYRGSSGAIKEEDVAKKIFAARALTYGTKDSYNTSFKRGCFNASLDARMPAVLWSHNSSRPIGKVTGYRDTEEGLDILVQFANTDAVPDARMAYSLLTDGIISGMSVGFRRGETEPDPDIEGCTRHVTGNLIEVSAVLDPAVKGTKLLGIRSESVNTEAAIQILEAVKSGSITADQALEALADQNREDAVEELLIRASRSSLYSINEDLVRATTAVDETAQWLREIRTSVKPENVDRDVEQQLSMLDSLLSSEGS